MPTIEMMMAGLCRLLPRISLYATILLLLPGCVGFTPPRDVSTGYLTRLESQQTENVSASAVVLNDEEAGQALGASLMRNEMQVIWLEIDNKSDEALLLMLLGIDPDYFSPSEAAWRSRRIWERRSSEKMDFFSDQHIPVVIPARTSVSGYVYTNSDPGLKAFTVQLVGNRRSYSFEFEQLIPGLRVDFEKTRPAEIYAGTKLPDLDTEGLRRYLEELPCCVRGGDRKTPGDPLNIVIVGEGRHALAAFARRSWDLTEVMKPGSIWRTVKSSLFKSSYRTSPVSPLYLFDRRQDIALQKTRGNVDERNHLRLWRAPVTYQGKMVWVGQISRDIGIKLSSKTVVTHKIDPEVDEARYYLLLDLMSSGSAGKVGYVRGVGESTRLTPRYNYTLDPYYTDGLRVVFFLSEQTTDFDEIERLDWERTSVD